MTVQLIQTASRLSPQTKNGMFSAKKGRKKSPQPTEQPHEMPLPELLPRGHLGELEPLLEIPNLTDIYVNAPDQVWYEAAGQVERSTITFASEQEVRALAVRLLTSAGKLLDAAHPTTDAQTVRGHRVHAVLPPVSGAGTILTIRLQPEQRLTLKDLEEAEVFSARTAEFLHQMMAEHRNFLISGGTGSGKTTLLNALLGSCEASERIITIEDTAELQVAHPHVVSLTGQQANAEGQGEVSLAELIRQSLRMRPNRLVLGECRGAEIADMLMAMNTGHRGAGGTVHANSAEAVPARLYALGALAGLSADALALQASTAFDVVLHLERSKGRRFVQAIGVLVYRAGVLEVQPVMLMNRGRSGKLIETWYEEVA